VRRSPTASQEARPQVSELDLLRSSRLVVWFARILLVPLTVLSLMFISIVIFGAWTGEVKEISKFSRAVIVRESNPASYWLAILYHCAIAVLSTWATIWFARVAVFRKPART
jgi:hypothetical protein